jgi:CDP-glucose 4,6-dehydratase
MRKTLEDFYRNRRIFITGHTGFKGSWLTQWLVDLGALVKGYSLEPPTTTSLFRLLDLANHIEHHIGDIRNESELRHELLEFEPEVVFHLAAQTLVRRSYREPKLTFETNVIGALNLYEAVRLSKTVHVVVCVTSDKCYENREWVWGYREIDPLGGYDPYSASKGCVELLTAAYRRSYFGNDGGPHDHHVALASARAGNVIGGGDWAEDRLIPDCIAALSRHEPIVLRNPCSTRPWQHVLEPLSGYMILAMKMYKEPQVFADSWNFGPENSDARTVEWIVSRLCSLWPGGGRYVCKSEGTMHEAGTLRLDCSKAYTNLQWRPRWDVDYALQKTVEWYVKGGKSASCIRVTKDQIIEYSKALGG